jgi:hypothetical protein
LNVLPGYSWPSFRARDYPAHLSSTRTTTRARSMNHALLNVPSDQVGQVPCCR